MTFWGCFGGRFSDVERFWGDVFGTRLRVVLPGFQDVLGGNKTCRKPTKRFTLHSMQSLFSDVFNHFGGVFFVLEANQGHNRKVC